MIYNLSITEKAEKQLDELVNYLLFKFMNGQAAAHLLDCVEKIYDLLEDNPFQFSPSKDPYLANKGYREAWLVDMKYRIIFSIEGNMVYVKGIFHELEKYQYKL